MTLDEFREFSRDMPGDTVIEILAHSRGFPLSVKRVVLLEGFPPRHGEPIPKNNRTIVFNPMGTHFEDREWGRIISASTGAPLPPITIVKEI